MSSIANKVPEGDETTEEMERVQEQLLKDLTHKMLINQSKANTAINDLVDESDIDKWGTEESDVRENRQGLFFLKIICSFSCGLLLLFKA